MEDRVYCAKVERLKRLQTVLMLWMAVLVSFVLSESVSERWGIVIPGEIILVGIDEVVFTKGKRRKKFLYAEIKEVQKMMKFR